MSREIDRERISPFLLRIFASAGSHQDIRDFTVERLPPARDEHVVYTWKDTSMRDIIVLLLASEQGSKLIAQGASRYGIRHVFLEESRGTYTSRDIGFVFARDLSKTSDELRGPPGRTLQSINFVVGDYLDIALLQGGASGPSGAFGERRVPSAPRGAFADRRNGARRGGDRGSRSPSPERPARGPDSDTWKR